SHAKNLAGYRFIFLFYIIANFFSFITIFYHRKISGTYKKQIRCMGFIQFVIICAGSIIVFLLAYQFTIRQANKFIRYRKCYFLGGFLIGFVYGREPYR